MSFVPVNYRKHSDSEINDAVNYAFGILNSILKSLSYFNLDVNKLRILELGPGKDFAAQLILASMGAEVTLADRFLSDYDPDYHGKLYQAVVDAWDGPKSQLLLAIGGGHDSTSLKLVRNAAESLDSIQSSSIDFTYSNAVLEHVYSFNSVAKELARVTKIGGKGSHQIDWRDHRDFSKPLEHLLMSDEEFYYVAPKVAYEFGNRLRSIEFCNILESNGFYLVERETNMTAQADYVNEFIPKLRDSNSIYRKWPEEDLYRISGRLYISREDSKLCKRCISHTEDIQILIQALKS